jgi:hypothetical protein
MITATDVDRARARRIEDEIVREGRDELTYCAENSVDDGGARGRGEL